MIIPLSQPDIDERDIDAVAATLRTPRLSFGPKLEEFERAIAAYVGVRHAVAVNSGTSGLHLCVRALGWGAGDEVVTTPFSFVASANVLLMEGVRPVFVDVEEDTLNIDPNRVAEALTSGAKGILPVHLWGAPADMNALDEIAERHGLRVLEDACEALGAVYRGRRAGALADAGVFGFYPNKQITAGEGGVIVTDGADLAACARRLRNQGRDPGVDWLDQTDLGYNYRISDISCALALAQLGRIEEILERRARVAALYDRLLAGRPELRLPPRVCDGVGDVMSWFVYVIRLDDEFSREDRDWIHQALAARGVMCGRYFAPIHLQPYYRKRFGFQPGDFPIAERAGERALALPFFNKLDEDRAARVCAALLECIARCRRRRVAASPSASTGAC